MPNVIAQGAEAVLTKQGNTIVKNRVKKAYRLNIIDNKIRRQRTKKEARLLEKASRLVPVPQIIKIDKNNNKIVLEYLSGLKLSENLDKLKNNLQVCRVIGQQIAILHDNNIIHGDLTTSNMIYAPLNKNKRSSSNEKALLPLRDKNRFKFKVYFIDFGLGFESNNVEDKAVDLHLIKQALEAKHFKRYEKYWKAILESYKTSKHYKETIKRLEAVEKRGRYKQAY